MQSKERLMRKPEEVAIAFEYFLHVYSEWRRDVGLEKLPKRCVNIHELCNAMTDKHGRICRHVKHIEREDPKEGWQMEMSQSIMGYIVYMIMLTEYYRIDIGDGIITELNKAAQQHAKQETENV